MLKYCATALGNHHNYLLSILFFKFTAQHSRKMAPKAAEKAPAKKTPAKTAESAKKKVSSHLAIDDLTP